ncbi:hypothetical protein G6514_007005 [Epicoccum nigrum]|nr:hypothetical protein G6514_007005 [Epicoccum nigrum]
MPPQKPSPHRFIAPAPPSSSTQTPKPKPKSNLRHAVSAHTHTQQASPQLQLKRITPAKRFVVAPVRAGDVVTPRAARDRVEERGGSGETGAAYAPRAKAGRKLTRVESIEEQSSPSRAEEEGELGVLRSVEDEDMSDDDDDDDDDYDDDRWQKDTAVPLPRQQVSPEDEEQDDGDTELLLEPGPRPKRRRTSPPSPTPSAVRAASPAHPKTPLPPPSHRFRLPAPTFTSPIPFSAISTTPSAAAGATPTRPSFLLPHHNNPPSPSKPPAPLPEIFSPSRKTGKHLPGGLAQTVRGWLIEAATTAQASVAASSRSREDGVRLRVRIAELGDKGQEADCFAGGVVLARGQTEPGMYNASRVGEGMGQPGTRLLLAGQGGARGAGVKVRVGDVVGVKAPTWDVDVGGEKWVVGVEWMVL